MYLSEDFFLENIAEKDKTYLYEHKTFTFKNGERYTPDFYCVEDNQYFEIIGNRSNFNVNEYKYKKLKKEYPNINFKIVWVDKECGMPRVTIILDSEKLDDLIWEEAGKKRISKAKVINQILQGYFKIRNKTPQQKKKEE